MNTTHQIITKYIDDRIEKAVEKASDKAADKAVKKYDDKMKIYIKGLTEESDRKMKIQSEELIKESKQHATDLKTFFSEEVKAVTELVKGYPNEERVREIVQDEIKTLKADVAIIKFEVSLINQKLAIS